MKNFICCSLTAIFLVLDMLAGNISLFPAFSVYTAVIFFLAYGWKYGVVSALFSGMVLDALYGHSFSYLSLIFLWKKFNPKSICLYIFPETKFTLVKWSWDDLILS